ncbi:MAG: hypothetical protein CSB44_01315 [Gammaproteobacteria bacterium]|nr:MAG: hypothetical protein CSB44_01315 [Gammaproteobacteria bacterium]
MIQATIPVPPEAVTENDVGGNSMPMAYDASLTDIVAFEDSIALAEAKVPTVDSVSEVAKAVFEPLDFINQEATSLADFANAAIESDDTLSPAEIVKLTVRSQEFMFHSQLTANIANRTADGVQQLFRQQS